MKLFNNQITIQIIISFVVSSIMSISTWLIGIRVGKERTDRAQLRDMYKEIYKHLNELNKAINSGSPYLWKKYLSYEERNAPKIQTMNIDGSLNILPGSLSKIFLDIESSALGVRFEYDQNVYNKVIPLIQNIVEEYVVDPKSIPYCKNHVLYYITYLAMQNEKSFGDIYHILIEEEECLRIFIPPKDMIPDDIYIHKDKMKSKSISEFLDIMKDSILTCTSNTEHLKKLKKCSKEIDSLLKLVESRINDPHPIFETIKNSVYDIFKR